MMRTVELPRTELNPSRLAFGSALLMARLGRRESVRLLEAAHEAGITHFDTARAYGYGEAESAVGEFLARHRESVTVATKLGMVPPRRSRSLGLAKTVARAAVRRAPAARRLLRRGAATMVGSGHFDPAEARTSLETSLRELAVETVDLLLLHECRPADLETEGLFDFLQSSVQAGKVRHFGIATDPHSTAVILAQQSRFAPVAQFEHNVRDDTLAAVPDPNRTAVITHSALREVIGPLTALLRDPALCATWSRELDLDLGRPGLPGRLLLAYALESNATGVVLFASTDEATIRANAALADRDEFSSEQIQSFARLARGALSPAA
jgi:D-threo-aldose 1-dehydrogenase